MVITLPLETVAELTYTLVSQKPTSSDSPQRWLTGLRMWRAILSGATLDVRAHMGTHIDIFDHALSFIPTIADRALSTHPRAGDWDTLARFPELVEEQQAWLDAGLLPGPTASSSEWPAVALLHACHQANQSPTALAFYFKYAYLKDAPSVMTQLLPWVDQVDLVQMMQEPAHGVASNPPIGMALFDEQAQWVRPVLLPYLPPEAVDVRDAKGNNALTRASMMTQQDIDTMVQAGMNPNARNLKGQVPEEVHSTFFAEAAAALNAKLKRHRSLEQHAHARHQMTAGMLACSALDDVKKFGDLHAMMANPMVEWEGEQIGILSYIAHTHAENRHLKVNETIDNMLHLLSGSGVTKVMRAEGGADKALITALALAVRKSGQEEFVGASAALRKTIKAFTKDHQLTFQGIFLDTLKAVDPTHISVFGNLLNTPHTLGLMEYSQQAGETLDSERWAQAMPVLGESLFATERTLGAVAQRAAPEYDTAGALLETLEYVLSKATIPDEERSTWLQGLLPAAVMARRRHGQPGCQDTLLERTVTSWLGELGMPQLSEEASEHLDTWIAKVAPDFQAHSRKRHLDQVLPTHVAGIKPASGRF